MEQPTNFMVVALFFDLSTFLIACISSFLVFRPFVALPVRCTAFLKVVLFPFLFHLPDCSYEEVEAEDDERELASDGVPPEDLENARGGLAARGELGADAALAAGELADAPRQRED